MTKNKKLEWQERWSVDVKSIDEEHKLLIDLLNDFIESFSEDSNAEKRKHHFWALLEHTKKHFEHEELVMRNIGFSKYQDHKAAHDELLAEIRQFTDALEEGMPQAECLALSDRLQDWLITHITKYDSSIRSHIQDGH